MLLIIPAAVQARPMYVVAGTGQSLSIGQLSNPALDTNNRRWRHQTFMTNLGIRPLTANHAQPTLDGSLIRHLRPIVESSNPDDGNGETISTSMLWTVEDLLRAHHQKPLLIAATQNGAGGYGYASLARGSQAYANLLTAVGRINAIDHKPTIVPVLTVIHGENDCGEQTSESQYESDLLQWVQDYDSDIRGITGQQQRIVEFTDQMDTCGATSSPIPLAQLAASVDHPDWVVLVGPKYQLPYVQQPLPYGLHLTALGEQWLGEQYGKVFYHVIVEGEAWKPLSPQDISIVGNVVTVDFNVPSPPLVFDTQMVSDPGNLGFEYTDDSGNAPTITNVAITGPAQVQLTLSAAPTANSRCVSYAYTGSQWAQPGPQTGPRGNLRDSDPLVGGYSHEPLFNWGVTFHQCI